MIVFKYGGTSLLDEEEVVKTVNEGLQEHEKIIIVVSAIGRYPYPYSTDALFKLCDCLTKEEVARIVSCGEIISSVRVSSILNKNYIKAISVSIYDIELEFDESFTINNKIKNYLEEYDVVVVPGFIGLKNNEPVLLPRGGSNITASFLAYHYKCDLVIFTDVDGLYTEDPKLNNKVERIPLLSYETLKDITRYNPALFPHLGIKYLEMGSVNVMIRTTHSKLGTMIKKI